MKETTLKEIWESIDPRDRIPIEDWLAKGNLIEPFPKYATRFLNRDQYKVVCFFVGLTLEKG